MTALTMTVLWDGNSPFYTWATLQRPTLWDRMGAVYAWINGEKA